MYSSSESKTSVSFNMLHRNGLPPQQQYTCPKDNGWWAATTPSRYEFAKDQYVILNAEEQGDEEKATG